MITAYKFRNFSNVSDLMRIKDIVLNRQLYCASWKRMNDICEGWYRIDSGVGLVGSRFFSGMRQFAGAKDVINVCSLSRNVCCQTLWAHYASEHSGVAIEIALDDEKRERGHLVCNRVKYRRKFLSFSKSEVESYDSDNSGGDGVRAVARKILLTKASCWKTENEIRLLTTEEFYRLSEKEKIKCVYCGARMLPEMRKTLEQALPGVSVVDVRSVFPDEFGEPLDVG